MPSGISKNGINKGWIRKGQVLSAETRRRMSLASKGKKKPPFSKEHRRHIGESRKGIKQSSETIAKRVATFKRIGFNPAKHFALLPREKRNNWKGGLSRTKEYKKEKAKEWIEKNRDRKYYFNTLRRVKKLKVGGTYSLGDWETLKIQYNWTCPACKKQEPEIKLDHISPVCYNDSICHTKTHKKRENTTNYIIKTIKKSLDCLVESGERKIQKEPVLSVKNTETPTRIKDMLFVKNGERIISEKYENNIEVIQKFALMGV